MPRKTARVDAFVDESIRGQTYYLCAVLIPFENQALLRQELRRISNQFGRRRIHFHNESRQRKELVLTEICIKVSSALIIRTRISHGLNEELARQRSLSLLIQRLQTLGIRRLTIETRSDNRLDELTILDTRRNGPVLDFLHLDALDDELLWVADAVVWAFGGGSTWNKKLRGISLEVIDGR